MANSLLEYVIDYLSEEYARGEIDPNDKDEVKIIVEQALDAYEGGAR